jgi:hypothetical protein
MPLSTFWSSLLGSLERYGLLVLVVLLGWAYWESTAPERQRERDRKEKDTIGIHASVTGNFWASAFLACRRIGAPNVNECAQHKGPLIEDMTAPASAQLAVSKRQSYEQLCLKHHDSDYCYELLNRAFQLALSRPHNGTD